MWHCPSPRRPGPAAVSRRQFLGLAGLASGSALVAACTSGRSGQNGRSATAPASAPGASPSVPTPSVPGRRVDVRSFGAVGDGRTDDTEALERALGSVRSGTALVLPQGHVFTHRRVLTLGTSGVSLLGPGRLLATAEGSSALKIEAQDVVLDAVSLGVSATTHRWSAPDQHKLYLGAHEGLVVRNVTVDGSAAAGVFCSGTHGFLLDHVRVSGTRADGIHMTNASHDGRVESPTTSDTGDDGVAVVSYASDAGGACHDIVVRSPQVNGTRGGRGISVVGGSRIEYHDIDVSRSNAAAVYVACESGDFVTYPVKDVRIETGRIADANTNGDIDHGAVLVYSGRKGGSVEDVMITGLDVTGTRATASRQIGVVINGSSCRVAGVEFRDLHLATQPTPYEGNAPTAGITLDAVSAGRRAVKASVTP